MNIINQYIFLSNITHMYHTVSHMSHTLELK